MAIQQMFNCQYVRSFISTGYMVSSIKELSSPNRTIILLQWKGDKTSLFSKPEDIIINVTVEIHRLTNDMMRIKVCLLLYSVQLANISWHYCMHVSFWILVCNVNASRLKSAHKIEKITLIFYSFEKPRLLLCCTV